MKTCKSSTIESAEFSINEEEEKGKKELKKNEEEIQITKTANYRPSSPT